MRGGRNLFLLPTAVLLAAMALLARRFAAGARFSAYLLMIAAGLLALLWGLNLLHSRFPRSKAWSRARRGYLVALAAGGAFFLILEAAVLYHARTDWKTEPDCLIVLGAGINGREPSPILKTRLDAALSYLEQWPGTKVILSGGQGENEETAEAEVMRDYLVRHGVSPACIFLEEQSTSTEENIAYSLRVIEELGMDPREISPALVTSDFHLCRAKLLARAIGMHPVGVSAETPYFYLRANYFAREAFALVGEFIVPSG